MAQRPALNAPARARARVAAVPSGAPRTPPRPATRAGRITGLDAARGLAILAMIAYHFCFDLRYFGVARWDFEHDAGWLASRSAILSSFLLIAGVSAVLANRQPAPLAHWLRHIATIAGAALLVSAGSYVLFPQSFIWFGVLHAIALSLLLARPLLSRPRLAALAGVAMVAAGIAYANPVFDNRLLGFVGFVTHKPITEDYVPLFPWMGVLLLGIAAGHGLLRTRFAALAPLARLSRLLSFLGRHSLVVYLVHQPLLLLVLWAALH